MRKPRRSAVSAKSAKGRAATSPGLVECAEEAGLRHVSDEMPGIMRRRAGKGWKFLRPDGRAVTNPKEIARIRRLAIPPGWTDVWICPLANGHIQATGRDQRRRKQYRYHDDWRAVRDATKYERLIAFGRALPGIRRRVAADLRQRGLGREKVLAAMVRLLETTHIRVGNDEYARTNGSYGLSTLRNRHVRVQRGCVHFAFTGKGGKRHDIDLHDPRLASIVSQLEDLPGQELFGYEAADGSSVDVKSDDVNAYLREIAGAEFSAKDFRTWSGTVAAARLLAAQAAVPGHRPTKRTVATVVKNVAEQLGNTPAVCRKCYIHPAVVDGYLAGETLRLPAVTAVGKRPRVALNAEERAVLALLERKAREPRATLEEQLQRSVRATAPRRAAPRGHPVRSRSRVRPALHGPSGEPRRARRAIA